MRNPIILISGVLLSFLLSLAGAQLAWLLIVGNVDSSQNKDAIIRWMLVETFGIAPAVAVIVGAFVALLVRRSFWWLGGVTLLPLLVYGLIPGATGIELVLSLAYVLLAFAAAFVVSRFKRTR